MSGGQWVGIGALAFVLLAIVLAVRRRRREMANYRTEFEANANAAAEAKLAAQLSQSVTVVAGNSGAVGALELPAIDTLSSDQALALLQRLAGNDRTGSVATILGAAGSLGADGAVHAGLRSGGSVHHLEERAVSRGDHPSALPRSDGRPGDVLLDRAAVAAGVRALDSGSLSECRPATRLDALGAVRAISDRNDGRFDQLNGRRADDYNRDDAATGADDDIVRAVHDDRSLHALSRAVINDERERARRAADDDHIAGFNGR